VCSFNVIHFLHIFLKLHSCLVSCILLTNLCLIK
jgi:hypothetical protein